MNPKALLNKILKLYSPPTLEGKAPSLKATNKALECSAIEYNPCKGNIFSLRLSFETPTSFATLSHSCSISSISSKFK